MRETRGRLQGIGASALFTKTTWVIAVALHFAACAAYEAPPEDVPDLFIASEEVVLTSDGDHVIASVSDIVMWGGRLAVVDRREANVKVYDPMDGTLVHVLGGLGDGPGEFRAPASAAVMPDGRLAVVDLMQGRVTLFDSLGSYDTSWDVPGAPMGGLGIAEDGTVYVSFRLVGEDGTLSPFGVHALTARGVLKRSFVELPEAVHFAEGNYNGLMVALVGRSIVTLSHTSNRVRVDDLATGRVDTVEVGRSFYRPIEWTLQPGDTPEDALEWSKRQQLAWFLVRVADNLFAVGFQEFDASRGEWGLRWVVADLHGEPLAESGFTDAVLGPLHGGLLHAVRVRQDGEAVLMRQHPPFRR